MLRMSENRAWRRFYGGEEEVTEGQRRVHNVCFNL